MASSGLGEKALMVCRLMTVDFQTPREVLWKVNFQTPREVLWKVAALFPETRKKLLDVFDIGDLRGLVENDLAVIVSGAGALEALRDALHGAFECGDWIDFALIVDNFEVTDELALEFSHAADTEATKNLMAILGDRPSFATQLFRLALRHAADDLDHLGEAELPTADRLIAEMGGFFGGGDTALAAFGEFLADRGESTKEVDNGWYVETRMHMEALRTATEECTKVVGLMEMLRVWREFLGSEKERGNAKILRFLAKELEHFPVLGRYKKHNPSLILDAFLSKNRTSSGEGTVPE